MNSKNKVQVKTNVLEHKDMIEMQMKFINSTDAPEPKDLVLINLRDLIREHIKRDREENQSK